MAEHGRARAPRPTLAHVARAAGVSSAAASMALNDREGISRSTRDRVLAEARRLGYRRRSRGTGLLGVLPTDLGNPYHTDVISGIEQAAEGLGLGVVIAHGRRDGAHLERQLQRLLDLGVDGIVAVTTWLRPAVLEAAAHLVPVVVIGRMQDVVPGTDTVRNHDHDGAALAVRHLVEHGHRRLAHVTLSGRPGPALRRAGFLAEAARLGLRDGAQVIGPDEASATEGIEMLLRAVRRGDPAAPTAVFAANDIAAVTVLHRAADLGVAVPERLSVIGYDSSAVALTVRPHLTSVNQPRQEMGRLAARMLGERFAGRAHDAVSTVEPVLTLRDSTGPGPARRARV
ncbi:LacI family DNA-binding transcriptional regulator [Brachybacterium saurashtrense]|uniref:LacI family transcriptional regulator n=1 Tax=Brachybacterium saurashtrense TaxID=556288 RepID=A0A345YQS5_9MICO|nr:substrate-binding domain-containing protein [Brachybacterium saurashtrense]AXK46277.1 LacI family transcriptional regulator [Brachybacterium saurashtrense]RRR24017.1 LacI family transcriptional regulator [Brachybacterium saurashtrense]